MKSYPDPQLVRNVKMTTKPQSKSFRFYIVLDRKWEENERRSIVQLGLKAGMNSTALSTFENLVFFFTVLFLYSCQLEGEMT